MNRNLILSLFQIACLGSGIAAVVGIVYFGERAISATAHTEGLGGATLGCSVITAVCILCCVWIELSKTKY